MAAPTLCKETMQRKQAGKKIICDNRDNRDNRDDLYDTSTGCHGCFYHGRSSAML